MDPEKDMLLPEDAPEGEPSGPPSGEPEPPAKEEPSELDKLAAENESLRSQLSDLVKTFGQRATPPPTYEAPPKKEVTPPADENFLEGIEVDKLFDDPAAVLNPLLNKVYQRGRESVMQDLPQLVQQHADQTYEVRMRAKEFWDANQDLKEFSDFVGLVANQVANENPTWHLEQVYSETAKRTRERLAPILQGKPSDEPPTKPALPSGPGSRRKPPEKPAQLSEEEKSMDAMWKEFGG